MPVVEGDSIIFSAVGFKRSYFVIPKHDKENSLKIILTLEEDVTFLEEVEINPYPSESIFKEAIISMELPEPVEYANIYQWLNSDYMATAYQSYPASPNENFRAFNRQQMQAFTNRYAPQQIPLLNPFAWAQFIQSLKGR